MAPLPGLTCSDVNRAAVRIEIRDSERGQLAISSPGYKRCLCQAPEIGITGVQEPLRLDDSEIPHAGNVGLRERLDTTPSRVGRDCAFSPSAIERGFQHCQRSVCACASAADRVAIAFVQFAKVRPLGVFLGAQTGRRRGEIAQPFLNFSSGQTIALYWAELGQNESVNPIARVIAGFAMPLQPSVIFLKAFTDRIGARSDFPAIMPRQMSKPISRALLCLRKRQDVNAVSVGYVVCRANRLIPSAVFRGVVPRDPCSYPQE
jgi:hypothetical protein